MNTPELTAEEAFKFQVVCLESELERELPKLREQFPELARLFVQNYLTVLGLEYALRAAGLIDVPAVMTKAMALVQEAHVELRARGVKGTMGGSA